MGTVNQHGRGLIHVAVINNRLGIVRYLIEMGVDVNLKTWFRWVHITSMSCLHSMLSLPYVCHVVLCDIQRERD